MTAAVGLARLEDERILTDGMLYGVDGLIWFSIVWQAAGGLIVALTIKYADNILRCFAQAGAIILIAVTSHTRACAGRSTRPCAPRLHPLTSGSSRARCAQSSASR